MVDQHKNKPTMRLPDELKAAVQAALDGQPERDEPWTAQALVTAFFTQYAKRPRTVEKQLEPFKPPRKRGRPRKAD